MKTLTAFVLAISLMLVAIYCTSITRTGVVTHSCSTESNYQNTWNDKYLLTDWLPYKDNQVLTDCIGPTTYVRYHPYDLAIVSFLGVIVASWLGYRSEIMLSKNTKNLKEKK